MQDKNSKYRRWQDRHANLFGKLLLIKALGQYGYSSDVLYKLKYNKYQRPFLDDPIDFNISHSGDFVVCAVGKKLRLGIDIERIQTIDFKNFKSVMTEEQWHFIHQSTNPFRTFFDFWAIKESVIKGDSRGLSIPLQELDVVDNIVHYDQQDWYLSKLHIDKEYSACMATDVPGVKIGFHWIDFYNNVPKIEEFIFGNGILDESKNNLYWN